MGRRGAEAARGDDVTENLKFREINNSLGRFQDEMVEYDTAIGLAVEDRSVIKSLVKP